MSLSGLAAVNQYSGVVIATATAATVQRGGAPPSSRRNSARDRQHAERARRRR